MSDPKIIIENVTQIKKLMGKYNALLKKDEKEFDKIVEKEVPNFATKYPTIYEKVKNKTLDDDKLAFMLSMLSKVNSSEMTQHNASVEVGKNLANTYVLPKLDDKNKRN